MDQNVIHSKILEQSRLGFKYEVDFYTAVEFDGKQL